MSEQQTLVEGSRHVLAITLTHGEQLVLDAGPDRDAARAELTALHARLDEETLVRLDENTIVRSTDIRSVTLRPRKKGVSTMSTYDTGQQDVAAGHTPMRAGQPQQQPGQAPGFVDQYIGYGRRPWAETKPFWLTSEFVTLLGMLGGIAIAMGVSSTLGDHRGWLLMTIVASAYIISRGIAKAGARDPNPRAGDSGRPRY